MNKLRKSKTFKVISLILCFLFINFNLVGCGGGDSNSVPIRNADVAGDWNVFHTASGEPGERGPDVFTFSQSGGNLTYTARMEDGRTVTGTGTISGNSMHVSWRDTDGFTLTANGTVNGNMVSGNWSDNSGESGTWRAMRGSTFRGSVLNTDTGKEGKTTIISETLGAEYNIEITDENGRPVQMAVDYFEQNGQSVIHIFDPQGRYTPAFIMGHPDDINPDKLIATSANNIDVVEKSYEKKLKADPGNDLQPAFIITASILLTVAVFSIAYAEVQIITDMYEIGTFYVTDGAVAGNGWNLYCKTWYEIAELIANRTDITFQFGSILIDFVSAGASAPLSQLVMDIGRFEVSLARDILLETAIVYGWGGSMAELEGRPVAVQVFIVEPGIAANLRQAFAPYRIYQDHPICDVQEGDVSGTIVDATDANPIANATVTIDGVGFETTDSNGQYSFTNVPAGTYTIRATRPNYSQNSRQITVTQGNPLIVNLALSPDISGSEEYRVVLTWGENPSDLDSHLWTPGGTYHIYYSSRGSDTTDPYAILDRDDTNSFGPETITIVQSYPGIYKYSIFNFSRGGDNVLSESGAHVDLYDSSGLLNSWDVPGGSGLWWNVFQLNAETGAVTDINQISSTNQ